MGNFFVTLGCFIGVLGPLTGIIRFWHSHGPLISPAGTVTTVSGLLLVAVGTYLTKGRISVSMHGAVAALLLLLLTDWITNPYSILKGPDIRGEILLGASLAFLSLRFGDLNRSIKIFAIASCLLLIWCLLNVSHGRFIYSDDHSVVLYRLSLLKENFPFIPFYNPFWNAGIDARDFFATGTLNIFTIGAPLLYLFNPQDVYNIIICIVLFIILPLSSYYAAKIDEHPAPVPALASLICITSSLLWYRWGLKYGSMGFVTSATLIPLNFVILKRLLCEETLKPSHLVIFIITTTLMLFWSLSGVVFLPLILIALFKAPTLLRNPQFRKVAIWILAINIPWMILFLSVSKVNNFISVKGVSSHTEAQENASKDSSSGFASTTVKGKVKTLTAQGLLKALRDEAGPVNPLILVLALPGILLMHRKSSKILFGATIGWLLLLGFIIAPFKPQLELDRMLIVCGILAGIPTASFIGQYLNRESLSRWTIAGKSFLLGIIFAGTFSVGAIIFIRTPEIYTFADDVFYDLAADIKMNAGDGRGVFLGFVLHEMNSGHLAPLMFQAGKPLVASTPYHNVWWYTNLVPKDFMSQGEVGIEKYLDYMNTSLVIVHERPWRDYCYSKPDRYEFISRRGVFNVFKRRSFPDTYFAEGRGTVVKQTSSSITARIDSEEAILKFTYFPFLQSTGCTLSPAPLPGNLTFIKVSNCIPGKEITITGKSGFRRLFN